MKTVIFGGTFNPIHIGHLHLADEVMVEYGYERVVFVPDYKPAHKRIKADISVEQRLRMVTLALCDTPFVMEDCEIKRQGISYTIDTVDYISKHYKVAGKLGIVIGDDLADEFLTWKKAEELVHRCDIVIAHRLHQNRLQLPFPHLYLKNVIIPISSSMLRWRIRQNQAYKYLLPAAVREYILSQGLYRG